MKIKITCIIHSLNLGGMERVMTTLLNDFAKRDQVEVSFETTSKLQLQCAAFDFVFDTENNPLLVELSYGFSAEVYDPCPGYWDSNLNWHEGQFNPQGWMVELIIREIRKTK